MYARLTSRYSPTTAEHPSASASGRLRLGLRTSPATMVMSCQASAANSDPDCATEIATTRPKMLAAGTPSAGSKAPRRNACVKFVCTAAAFHPSARPTTTSAPSASVLAEVKMVWTILPYSRPRVLVQVSSAMTPMATACAVESENA